MMKQEREDVRRTAIRRGVVISTLFGIIMVVVSTMMLEEYGFVLFLGVPFFIGLLVPMVAGFSVQLTAKESIRASLLALGLAGIGLIVLKIEGLICIIMAAPIAGITTFLGSTAGDYFQKLRWKKPTPVLFTFILLLPPGLLTVEYYVQPDTEIRPITTTIEINAPTHVVWDHVVSFPELAPPTEFLFKSGIAYPIRARIEGSGVGAVRYCDFSTGSFVEPITHWEENKRLAFSVEEQPIPMKELSPYNDLEPAHLHGYFVSTRGEFRLIDLGNGRTRLEGTTWYYQKLRPGFYWNLWADQIIHTIHSRVLNHIKRQAEVKAIQQDNE